MCERMWAHQRQIYIVKRRGRQTFFFLANVWVLWSNVFKAFSHKRRRKEEERKKRPRDVTDVTWKAGCVWHSSLWTHSAAVWSVLSWSLHPRSRCCQNGAERLWRSHAREGAGPTETPSSCWLPADHNQKFGNLVDKTGFHQFWLVFH